MGRNRYKAAHEIARESVGVGRGGAEDGKGNTAKERRLLMALVRVSSSL